MLVSPCWRYVLMYLKLFLDICVFVEKELVTPPLDGVILPGVTRQSLLDLAREWVREV